MCGVGEGGPPAKAESHTLRRSTFSVPSCAVLHDF